MKATSGALIASSLLPVIAAFDAVNNTNATVIAASDDANFTGQSFLNRYVTLTDVEDVAALDLDLRSLVARLALGGESGLQLAREVYFDGRLGTSNTTIRSIGVDYEKTMGVNSNTFKAFKSYYGAGDYMDRFIMASFEGRETDFVDGNADFRFQEFGAEGRIAFITYATVALTIWINVLGRLETAENLCWSLSGNTVLPEWDRAVAYYTGSLAMADGGHFLNTLAQIECAKFGTCKEGDMAPVNDQIFDLFNDGKANLQQSNCIKLEQNVADIRSLMTVPLLQGTLRAAHALDSNPDFQNTETTQGQGAAFAASILPLLNKCSAGNAQIVLNDLMPSKSVRVSYEVVKGALERSYDCFGVSCGDVGGILNLRKDGYLKGAEACGNVRPVESDVDYDDTLDDEEEDDRFEYEDYSYPIKPAFPSIPHSGPKDDPRSGTGDGHTGEPMDPTNAAILSGIAFGIFGFVGGAAITVACKSRKQKKKQSEVEFVTSSNGNGAIDENDVI